MEFRLFAAAAAVLLALRLGAQWWARGSRPAGPVRGRLSVIAWFWLYCALLGAALLRVHQTGEVAWAGVAVIGLALLLRLAGLVALRGRYHEAIALQDDHSVVRHGVYRALRHPLHLSLLLEMAGLALLTGALWSVACVAVTLAVLLDRNRSEERVLLAELGEDYADYLRGPAWDLVDLLPGSVLDER